MDGSGQGLPDAIFAVARRTREAVPVIRAYPVEDGVWWGDGGAFTKVLEVDKRAPAVVEKEVV